MRLRRKFLLALLSIAAPCLTQPGLAQKDDKPFRPLPASSYPSHQTIDGLKIAAVAYERDADTKGLFGGKTNPNEYEILPVLLVMENSGGETLQLDRMEILYETPDRQKLRPIPAKELPYTMGVKRPSTGLSYPAPIPLPKRKNPLSALEFDTRAWAAKMLLKGDNAFGFLYFWTRHSPKAILYISGIREASTGKEIFYAEVPIDPVARAEGQ